MSRQVYISGKFVPQEDAKISVFDHGLLYGDGIFEGLRSYRGKVFRLQEHVVRLYESAKAKAEALVQSEFGRKGWSEEQLAARRKGDPFKVSLARRLGSETTVTMARIARRLQMGTRGHSSHLFYWNGKEPDAPNVQQPLNL